MKTHIKHINNTALMASGPYIAHKSKMGGGIRRGFCLLIITNS